MCGLAEAIRQVIKQETHIYLFYIEKSYSLVLLVFSGG